MMETVKAKITDIPKTEKYFQLMVPTTAGSWALGLTYANKEDCIKSLQNGFEGEYYLNEKAVMVEFELPIITETK